ncbi:hypothetical protein, partial [Extensimonas vulgaris]|uniref:hypothetical protein n=1 Tax=Extensimonas vulgaris TaxID=1031594 RepID=UPI0019D60242
MLAEIGSNPFPSLEWSGLHTTPQNHRCRRASIHRSKETNPMSITALEMNLLRRQNLGDSLR